MSMNCGGLQPPPDPPPYFGGGSQTRCKLQDSRFQHEDWRGRARAMMRLESVDFGPRLPLVSEAAIPTGTIEPPVWLKPVA